MKNEEMAKLLAEVSDETINVVFNMLNILLEQCNSFEAFKTNLGLYVRECLENDK